MTAASPFASTKQSTVSRVHRMPFGAQSEASGDTLFPSLGSMCCQMKLEVLMGSLLGRWKRLTAAGTCFGYLVWTQEGDIGSFPLNLTKCFDLRLHMCDVPPDILLCDVAKKIPWMHRLRK